MVPVPGPFDRRASARSGCAAAVRASTRGDTVDPGVPGSLVGAVAAADLEFPMRIGVLPRTLSLTARRAVADSVTWMRPPRIPAEPTRARALQGGA